MVDLFKVALPLSMGNLVAYAEWEILTVFAAVLGDAEGKFAQTTQSLIHILQCHLNFNCFFLSQAAAWGILGFIWEVFESTTEAIGDAAEVRVAYQLGKGRPELAKLSAYKSILLAFTVSIIVTTIFLGCSSIMPSWLTKDPTLQAMLVECIPLIALGNVTMNMGMVSWALVGAQGRYRLATSVATACTFLITLPIAAAVTVGLNINLQGLTFSVVIGYTITAMILSTIILGSDWQRLSQRIIDSMEDSDSDEDSSSSSSSSEGSSSQQMTLKYSVSVSYVGIAQTSPTASPTRTHADDNYEITLTEEEVVH